MSRSIKPETPLHRYVRRLAPTVLLVFLMNASGICNPFFSYPRDGHFKFAPSEMDRWYYLNPNQIEFQTPDKWQHYMGNYLFAGLSEKAIGKWPTVVIFTSLNVLKEVEDGYREGASFKDLSVGLLGMIASISNRSLICTFDEEKIVFKYSMSL